MVEAFDRRPGAPPPHSLLRRQIRRCFPEGHPFSPEGLCFIEVVNDAYVQSDTDRLMVERSLHLSSNELLAANAELRGLLRAVEATSGATGDAFFRKMVLHLCKALEVDFAVLSVLENEQAQRARTVAWCEGDRLLDNVQWDLAGTGDVERLKGSLVLWPAAENQDLPQHPWLTENEIAARMDLVLRDSSDRPQGFLTVLSRSPISRRATAEAMLRIFAIRASAELERLRDLIERRKMEARISVSERMASVGTLAAGVAHEINNPLCYVLANLTVVGDALATLPAEFVAARAHTPLSDLQAAVREALEGADRVKHIVRDLRSFSRCDDERREVIDVRRAISSAINMARNEIRHRAQLVRHLQAVPPIEANEGRIGQVILNLLINAAHAIDAGSVDANEVRVSTSTDGDGRVVIEVSDTGCGIAPEVLPRIFDPFFTTKPQGAGTGLGLAICHGIVTQYGGEMSVESEDGHGTVFRVVFPAASGVAPEEDDAKPLVAPVSRMRVLVIDDEPLVTTAVRRMLREHHVDCVQSGRSGLHAMSSARYDLVLCDIMMPDMTGMDLHAEVENISSDEASRLVFITGGAFTPRARAFLDRVPNARLEKPIDAQELRALLGTRAST